jgi:ABC-type amino acid transport substrate-binding protein
MQHKLSLFIIILILAPAGHLSATTQALPALKVGISPFSPFVIKTEDQPIGYSIDAWKALARELDIRYEFVMCAGVADKLQRLEQGRIDVAIGGITITEKRELKFDFTHSIFHTGLDILVPNTMELSILKFFSSLFTGKKMIFIVGLLIMIFIAGHIIWLVERSSVKRQTMFEHDYFPGVFQGMYWALITASTIGYGDKVPKRWIGRILAAVLILIFLPLFGYFIAELSSDLTIQQLKSNISGPNDLWGRRVAVVAGTTSEDYMRNMHVLINTYKRVEDAVEALELDLVDAVVYDAPNLLYHAKGEGKDKVTVVGKIFEPQDYGLVVPQGSPLREKLNRAILTVLESDELEGIQQKWFGK